jgi:hypothetical protein
MAEQLTEEKEQIYVWAKTERAGDIVTVDKTDGKYVVFTDGTKCATNLINEMLLPARDEAQAKSIAKPFSSIQDIVDNVEPVVETTQATPVQETNTSTKTDNVMLEMLKKLSAKNTIEMPLQLNIPSHEVYQLFKGQMDITEEDLHEQILALVLSQIDNLQAQLKPQAEEFINNYYNGRTNRKSNTGTSTTAKSGPDITY